jgi:hypothetical protein
MRRPEQLYQKFDDFDVCVLFVRKLGRTTQTSDNQVRNVSSDKLHGSLGPYQLQDAAPALGSARSGQELPPECLAPTQRVLILEQQARAGVADSTRGRPLQPGFVSL